MRILLDQGLPRSVMMHLAALGIPADHVGDIALHAASDETILLEARGSQSVVVTLDADFHRILASTRTSSPPVIRIRIERLKGDSLANLIQQVLAVADRELDSRAVVSVGAVGIRVRRLPIGRIAPN